VSPLLLLHGFTGSPRSFAPLARRLSQDFEILTPALLGHAGSSAGPEVTSFDAEVERLVALIPEGSSAHLAGYSLGARLGLALLCRHPERFARATLVGVNPGLSDERERELRRQNDAGWVELLEVQGLKAFVEAWQAQPLFDSQRRLPEGLLAAQTAERLSHSSAGLALSLRLMGLAEMPDLWRELERVRTRVTLLVGALDERFVDIGRQLATRLPQAELRVAEGAGHNLLLENPDLVTEAISEGIQP